MDEFLDDNIGTLLSLAIISASEIDLLIVNISMLAALPFLFARIINCYKLHHDVKVSNLTDIGCSASLISFDIFKEVFKSYRNKIQSVWDFCKEDTGNVIFALKARLAVLLVSLLILFEAPYTLNIPSCSFSISSFRDNKKKELIYVCYLEDESQAFSLSSAILTFLNEAYITHSISQDKFEGIVSHITADNHLSFVDEEIPPRGADHNKLLHIFVKCKEYIIAKVLVDYGSSLNVMPKRTLEQMMVEGVQMHPSNMIVRAFDGP
ncbi:hypothetical protein Fmac_005859 [Flemingia macrophylla]|uniref:FAE domain-containing protein n=1 Tax=Flemingia macrophylla TaxID=520843 RepID=A0ABD1N8Z1_9FABA